MADGQIGWGQAGIAGLQLFAFIVAGKFMIDRMLSLHQTAIKTITDSNEKINTDLSSKMQTGFAKVADVMERRDTQQQGLFDKHLDVTIKVTESLGIIGRSVADNTREIADVKAAVKELQRPRAGS